MPTAESELPRPFSPYGVTKLAAEHLCFSFHDNYGLRSVALRYFSVYGPRQRPDMAFTRFCSALLEGQEIEVYGDGLQTRDFTFVADVVRATRLAAESSRAVGNAYNVGGGSQIGLRAALELLEDISGEEARVQYQAGQEGDVRDTGAETVRAREDLGFEPATILDVGLRRQFEWAAEERQRSGTSARHSIRPRTPAS
jgi:nucleoside-diphosphate-sugar epimerase